jgi:hypothetical protein
VIGALASPAPRSDGGKADLIRRLARMQQVVPTGYCKILLTVLVSAATIAAVLVIGLSPRRAVSLPLYARQTGQPCATCHTAFLELTPWAGEAIQDQLNSNGIPRFLDFFSRGTGSNPVPSSAESATKPCASGTSSCACLDGYRQCGPGTHMLVMATENFRTVAAGTPIPRRDWCGQSARRA